MADATRQVLDELIEAMKRLASVPPGNVFEDPSHAIAEGKIPAAVVEPSRNPAEDLAESQDDTWIDRHRFQVVITGLGKTPAERDQIVLDVKRAVIAAKHVGRRRRYIDSEYGRSTEGAVRAYGARIFFEIAYLTPNTAPDRMI